MPAAQAFGSVLAACFSVEEGETVTTRALRRAEISATEVCATVAPGRISDELPVEDAYMVGLQLHDYAACEHWEDGRPAPRRDLLAGDVLIYDVKRRPRFTMDRPFHSIHFHLPRAALNAIADEANARRIGELDYELGAPRRDATIQNLGMSMRAAFRHPDQVSRLFLDHVTLAVGTHVAEAYGGLRPGERPARGGLAPWQAKRAQAYIAANLDGGVALKDVAEQCGLSVSHFTRAFRQSVGLPPHAWLLARRVERAKSLLRERRLSLSEVALACGFADQSHFTRVFSRHVGVSPGLWRREA